MSTSRSLLRLLLASAAGAALVLAGEAEVVQYASPSSAAEDALRALDTDHSGKVELAELEAFARSQGMSAEEVRQEFAELDTDGDGVLGPEEIGGVLGSSDAPAEVIQSLPAAKQQSKPAVLALKEAPAAVVAAKKQASAKSAGAVASGVSSEAASGHLVALGDLEHEAQQHAGKALAQVFARRAALALEARSQDALKAAKLEVAAHALREQTAAIKNSAAAETARAAREAAAAVYRKASDQVRALEREAEAAEQEAASRRAEAKAAMDRALRAQADMAASVRKLRGEDRSQ